MVTTCRFCQLGAADDVVRHGSVYLLRDAYPVTPGHHLIIPTSHRRDYFELSSEELLDTHLALRRLQHELLLEGAEGFNIGWNCGATAGQTVDHAHCHVIPRRAGDIADPTGGVRGVIPARQNYKRKGAETFEARAS